jgi:hypothetical protein
MRVAGGPAIIQTPPAKKTLCLELEYRQIPAHQAKHLGHDESTMKTDPVLSYGQRGESWHSENPPIQGEFAVY